MSEVSWTHRRLWEILEAVPVRFKTAIDLGCGKGIMGSLLRIYRPTAVLTGLDCYEPYLMFCRKHDSYDHLVRSDLEGGLPWSIHQQYFDLGLCVEVLEHLSRAAGNAILNWLESNCKTAIVTTPTRFFQQPAYDGNDKQLHHSLWTPYDFKPNGWKLKRESSEIYHWLMVKLGRSNGTILAVKKP